jgi:hypothetical protein
MAYPPANKFGRKPGRGARPWMLLPKVIAVGVFFGAVATAAMIFFRGPGDDMSHAAWVGLIADVFRFVAVPALIAAMLFGAMLFMQHPRLFLLQRWFQVKAALIVGGVPAGHLFMASRIHAYRTQATDQLHTQIAVGLIVTLAWTACIIMLGRHKPKLGQNWAKVYIRWRDATKAMAWLATGLSLLSCETPQAGPAPDPLNPVDFTLSVYVVGDARADKPIHRTAMYVLEADRRLFVGEGYTVEGGYRPPLKKIVSQSDYRAIVELVYERGLLAEPSSPRGERAVRYGAGDSVVYHVDMIGWGRINRYVTTPEESPTTAQLVARLIIASDGDVMPRSSTPRLQEENP